MVKFSFFILAIAALATLSSSEVCPVPCTATPIANPSSANCGCGKTLKNLPCPGRNQICCV